MIKRPYFFLAGLVLIFSLIACSPEQAPSPTAVSISRVLATVYLSPTPNDEEFQLTRAAVTATFIPSSPTVIPTETPYVGIFIGEAEVEESFVEITSPLFAPAAVQSEPTANAERCLTAPIDLPYLAAWRTNPSVNQRLGCPIQGGFGFFGEAQVFETGVMYHYPELNAIWAIRPLTNGNRGEFDYLENPLEQSTIGLQAPQGLILPGGIFGSMWLGVEGLREEMGFARTASQDAPMGMQRFENGTFLLDVTAGQVYALVTDGTAFGPFLASESSPALITTPTPAPSAEATEAVQG